MTELEGRAHRECAGFKEFFGLWMERLPDGVARGLWWSAVPSQRD